MSTNLQNICQPGTVHQIYLCSSTHDWLHPRHQFNDGKYHCRDRSDEKDYSEETQRDLDQVLTECNASYGPGLYCGESSAGGDCVGQQQGDQAEYVKYSHQRCRQVSPPRLDLNTPPPPVNDSVSLPRLTVSLFINMVEHKL